MRDLQTAIVIRAPQMRVWQVLTDFASYAEWNPFLRQASGDLSPGAALTVQLHPPGTRVMTVQATVLNVEAGHELVWQGRLWGIRGLLDSEQHFTLEPHSSEAMQLRQRVILAGMLTFLPLSGTLAQRLQRGMEAMNLAVKDRAEQGASPCWG